MDGAKKQRRILRSAFTRTYNALLEHLEAGSTVEARATFAVLSNNWEKLRTADEVILAEMMKDDESFENGDLDKETTAIGEYETKYELMNVRIQDILTRSRDDGASRVSNDSFNPDTVKSFHPNHLPKLDGMFDGQLKNWLPFWGQFEQIHEDENIPTYYKYRLLLQSTKEGSRSRRIVESFPPSKNNTSYEAAINALKERYGRIDLLIEVYIRELLTIVISNAKSEKLDLDELYDQLECHLRFLEILGVTTGNCAAILCPLLESCLTPEFLRAWQRSCTEDEVTDADRRLIRLRSFIKTEVQGEQRILLAKERFGMSESTTSNKKPCQENPGKFRRDTRKDIPTATGLLTQSGRAPCIFCSQQNHESVACFRARDMSLDDKLKVVKDSKCCYLCLKRSHSSKICRLKSSCALCDRKHAIILCPNYSHSNGRTTISQISTGSNVSGSPGNAMNVTTSPVNVTTNANLTCDPTVLIPTLRVQLQACDGEACTVRAVIDTAAQRSYILNSTASRLGYKTEGQEVLFHSLFGGRQTGMTSHFKYKAQISKLSGEKSIVVDLLGHDTICGELPTLPRGPWIKEMITCGLDVSNILNDSGPIEILLGADVAFSLYTGNVYKFSFGTLVGVETILGWTVSGKLPTEFCKTTLGMLTTSMLVNEMNIADLWKLEILGIEDPAEKKSKAEEQANVQLKFLESLKVDDQGRYEVHLPWKEEHSPLPSNYNLALKRMYSTYRKLENDGYLSDYNNVFKDWLNEGVIEEVLEVDNIRDGHYLPHRHIVKLNSTTKIRPVFDASAREKNSPSLNMCLHKGCNLIEQIPPLLHRFRLNKIGVIADIRRAFLQIGIVPGDREFLKFLWLDAEGKIKTYRHKRVVFGLTSSPFLLGAVINQHLLEIMNNIDNGDSKYLKSTIETLTKCFYVDNAIASFDSREELETFIREATSVLADGKFDLRGWESSDSELTTHTNSSVLGLCWDRKDDTLSLSSESLKKPEGKITKRLIMSAAHKIFDPLGLVSPVTLFPRILIQQVWAMKLEWDEEVPLHIQESFLQWVEEIDLLQNVKVPRWLSSMTVTTNYSIHTFCDACETSYAAVIFLRVEGKHGVRVLLMQSKARVAPKTTIPRKELLAATIGSRLYNSVCNNFTGEYESYFWSDSSTVLAWLRRTENWAPFVMNRVNEIRKLTDIENWHHVPGTLNPADLPSRGCLGKEFVESRWWEGPEWLYQPKRQWPSISTEYNEDLISKERRKTAVSTSMTTINARDASPKDWYYRHFSHYPKLIRMIAWMKRFFNNSRSGSSDHYVQKIGPLTLDEITTAELLVFKMVQNEEFQGIKDPKITCLNPFMDHNGLIRLRTKISNRHDSEDFRHPILLPRGHPVVTRLIRSIHERECHVGVQGLLAITRERFWILGGRRTLKAVTTKCVICRRHETKRLVAPTTPLPVDRVRDAAAFEVTGVDLAGPIFLKNQQKAWICIFTCAVTRAVHLELISSLSTDDFLQALKRFIARRGRPARIYSDQGTNFIGANNLFQKINWSKVLEYSEVRQISWKFNPPTAAWWGGWWERLIGLTKRLLRKVLGRSILSYTEMATVLCDCESVLNSRPLTFISEEGCAATPLTPSLFIQDIKESGLPEMDVIESVDLKKTWQQRLKLKEDFRRRFRAEYLGQLQTRINSAKHDKINVGDLVLIGNDITKRMDWPIAQVIELLPGKDGITRLYRLKTSTGTCLRPIQRLYPLIEGDAELGVASELPNEDTAAVATTPPIPAASDDGDGSRDHLTPLVPEKKTSHGRVVRKPGRFCD